MALRVLAIFSQSAISLGRDEATSLAREMSWLSLGHWKRGMVYQSTSSMTTGIENRSRTSQEWHRKTISMINLGTDIVLMNKPTNVDAEENEAKNLTVKCRMHKLSSTGLKCV